MAQETSSDADPKHQLSITPTKPWRWPSQTDDLSFTVGGLVDGDLADYVVTGTLSREPGNSEGSYAINMGTLAVTDAYAEKYGLPNAPTIATYDVEPWPHSLSIWLTKPWKRLGEADDLSYTLNGLVDGDRVEDVLTGALAREPGEDLGRYSINIGTLAIADPFVRKYWMGNRTNPGAYWITDLPAANFNEDEVGDARGSVLFLEDQVWWENDEYLPPGEHTPLGNSLNVTPGMPVSYFLAPTTSPKADVMIEVKTDPPVDWIWGEYSSWTPHYLLSKGPFTFHKGDAPGMKGSVQVQITPGPDASGTVTITHTGLSADPKYNGRLGTFTINVAPRQPGECSSLSAPTVVQRADHVVGIAAGPAECGSRLIVGYETQISENGGPWQPLHSYAREWRFYSGKVGYLTDRLLKPATLEFAGSPGVAYLVRSRGIADDTDGPSKASEATDYGAAKTIATSWSPVTDFTIADRALSTGNTDYDADADGLIEVSSLAQLDAIRWDLDGNGSPDLLVFRARYAAAFPDAVSGMGCPPSGCKGYELTTDLDFDTNGNGQADAGDTYWNAIAAYSGDHKRTDGRGWIPLGERFFSSAIASAVAFAAVFDGNGHVIRNLYISGNSDHMGLFSRVGYTGVIRNVGLESVDVTSRKHQSGLDVGGLVGLNEGIIKDSYVTGAVSGTGAVGGLVGGVNRRGVINDSYATASVTGAHSPDGATGVGGLVGTNSGKVMGSYATGEVSGESVDAGGLVGVHWGLIKASYATGDVSANGSGDDYNPEAQSGGGLVGVNWSNIEASYATGEVSGEAAHLGGLVGHDQTGIAVLAGVVSVGYWNTDSSGLTTSSGGVGKTGAELVTPTGYAGIYADWNVDLDSDGNADAPWDFGTDSQYPVLKRVGPGVAEQRAQLPSLPTLEPATYSVSAAATAVEGENAALTITLGEAAPTGGVAFTVTASYPASGATADDLGSITSPVTVREGLSSLEIAVPTVDDTYDEDDETFTVTVATVSSDWTPAGVGRDTATVTIKDDDTAGVSVNAASPLAVAEGGSATYTVVLDSQPTEDVTVSASSNDAGAATVYPASHTFTPSGWNTPLTFTVSGVADDDINDETVAVSHGATSDDGKYGAVLLSTVSVTVSDTTTPQLQQQQQTPQEKYADLITKMKQWRDDPCCASNKDHTDRWDRALLTFGETVADATLAVMTAAEAQTYADRGWTRWVQVAQALRELENRAPTVSNSIADATIVSESGTRSVSLVGVFSDADNDSLTITAASSDQTVATALAATDNSTLTVTAQGNGTATITVTADDGNGGTVSDTFTAEVKAAPVVASALADVSGLEEDATQDVSLSGVFSDADGDALTITATSSDDAIATVTVATDQTKLTVAGVSEGTATITVTAEDADGNRVSDSLDVSVPDATADQQQQEQTTQGKYASLITKMKEWRDDPCCASHKPHTDRWDRTLLAFGETVADTTLTVMTATEAQTYADRGWTRWVEVAAALRELENQAPMVAAAIGDVTIVSESGTEQVSLSGVFSDADGDALTITAGSSAETVATVSVASDYSTLTMSAKSRGTATITVTASDGKGGTVSDAFTVKVKAAPTVSSAISDVSLEEGGTQEISLDGVFIDADGDSLTLSAASSDDATVSAFEFHGTLTIVAVSDGTATITVTAQDADGNTVSDAFDVSVAAQQQQQQQQQQDPPPNQAPTVASAISDATIVNESGTRQVSLSGVFDDADGNSLTVTAQSSAETVATVSVAPDYSTLTVSAKARGTATITVTAKDGNGGSVSDTFSVTVKAAPTVASSIGDISGLEAGSSRDVSLSGVFSDADSDSLTITAASSDEAFATVTVAADQSKLTVAGVAEGTATITVTAQDSDGNRVSDDLAVSVVPAPEEAEPEPASPTGAPTVVNPLADISLEGPPGWRKVSLSGVFHDPDGDDLTITVESSDHGVASMLVDGSTLTVLAMGTGTATITVTAEDPDGNRVNDKFEVTVTPAS